jgi:predicted transcriptional regulator
MDLDAFFGDGEQEEEEVLYQHEEPSYTYMLLSLLLMNLVGTFIGNTRTSPVSVQCMDWAEHRDLQIRRGVFN